MPEPRGVFDMLFENSPAPSADYDPGLPDPTPAPPRPKPVAKPEPEPLPFEVTPVREPVMPRPLPPKDSHFPTALDQLPSFVERPWKPWMAGLVTITFAFIWWNNGPSKPTMPGAAPPAAPVPVEPVPVAPVAVAPAPVASKPAPKHPPSAVSYVPAPQSPPAPATMEKMPPMFKLGSSALLYSFPPLPGKEAFSTLSTAGADGPLITHPDDAPAEPASAQASSSDDPDPAPYADIQARMRSLDIFHGEITGILDWQTRAALMRVAELTGHTTSTLSDAGDALQILEQAPPAEPDDDWHPNNVPGWLENTLSQGRAQLRNKLDALAEADGVQPNDVLVLGPVRVTMLQKQSDATPFFDRHGRPCRPITIRFSCGDLHYDVENTVCHRRTRSFRSNP